MDNNYFKLEKAAYKLFLNTVRLMPQGRMFSLVIEDNTKVVESALPYKRHSFPVSTTLQQMQHTHRLNTEGGQPNYYLSDKQLMGRIYEYITAHIQNETLRIDDLVTEFALSRSQLFRKVKAMSNKTPAQLIRDYRLDTAYCILQTDKTRRISEVMYAVGFNDVKHFGKIFKQRFGMSPQKVKK